MYLDPRKISVNAFAQGVRMNLLAADDLLEGKVDITDVLAERIAAFLGTTSTLWINGQKTVDEWDAKQGCGEVCCGKCHE